MQRTQDCCQLCQHSHWESQQTEKECFKKRSTEVLCPVSFFWATTCGALGSRQFLHRGLYWAKKPVRLDLQEKRRCESTAIIPRRGAPGPESFCSWQAGLRSTRGLLLPVTSAFHRAKVRRQLRLGQYTGDPKCGTSWSLDSFGVASCLAPEVQMANRIWGIRASGDTPTLLGS